jgi:hypothetical protein
MVAVLDKQIIYLIIFYTHFCPDGTFTVWVKSVIGYLKIYMFSLRCF